MGKNSIQNMFFFALRTKKPSAKGRSPPQELEEGPHSGRFLLVIIELKKMNSE